MKTLEQLKTELLSDGVIDASEVEELESQLYADSKIDSAEADFLFELNNVVSGKDNHPTWGTFFVKAISDYILEDEDSPNEIDSKEAEWLYKQIKGDGQIDIIERALLLNLKNKSKNFPYILEGLL